MDEKESNYESLFHELDLILDNIPALIFYKDLHNRFLRVNKYLADAHNLTKAEMNGKSCFDLYPKEQAEHYLMDDLDIAKAGKPKLNIIEKWNTKDGERWVSTSKIPILEKTLEISKILGIRKGEKRRDQSHVAYLDGDT